MTLRTNTWCDDILLLFWSRIRQKYYNASAKPNRLAMAVFYSINTLLINAIASVAETSRRM